MPDTFVELHRRINALERQVNSLSRRAKAHGWQLDAFLDRHRYGGGKLRWTFSGHSTQIGGSAIGGAVWTENNIDDSNYACALTGGGPYIALDGGNEYLSSADAAWQETGVEEFLVFGWCYLTSLANNGIIAAKYDSDANTRSWRLSYDTGTRNFMFLCNATGLVANDVTVISTYATVVVDTWYFVAGYFQPSTLMRIYVGANDDTATVVDSLAVGVPASLFNGAALLTIGYETP